MGFASYLDSIRDKINIELHSLREISNESSRARPDDPFLVKKISSLIRVCEDLLQTVEQHEEIASDPSMDMSHEILRLAGEVERGKEENGRLSRIVETYVGYKDKYEKIERERKIMERQLTDAVSKTGRQAGQLYELKKKYSKLEKEVKKAARRR